MTAAAMLKGSGGGHAASRTAAFGSPRDFLENRFVYVVVSPRARGLSVGVNMNPDQQCNFDCAYCEVDRAKPGRQQLDVEVMATELETTLALARSGGCAPVRPLKSCRPSCSSCVMWR